MQKALSPIYFPFKQILALVLAAGLHCPCDVAAVGSTCRRLRRLCTQAPLRLVLPNTLPPSASNEQVQRQAHVTLTALCRAYPGTVAVDFASLPVDNTSVAVAAWLLPNLAILNLSGCKKLTTEAVDAIARKRSLRSVDLQRCFQLHSGALSELLQHSMAPGSRLAYAALSHLDLASWRCTSRGALSPLRVLALHNCSKLTAEGLGSLAAACPALEVLCLGGCATLLADLGNEDLSQADSAAAETLDQSGAAAMAAHHPLNGLNRAELTTLAASLALPRVPLGAYSRWLRDAAVELAAIALQLQRLRVLELTFCPPGLAKAARHLLGSTRPSVQVWDLCDASCVFQARDWLAAETLAHKLGDPPGALPPSDAAAVLRAAVCCSSPGRATPLHCAAEDGAVAHVDALLALGAGVSAKDRNGAAPLFLACEAGHAQVAARLLGAGANATACNTAGEAPLYIAALRGHQAVVEVLLQHCSTTGIKWIDPKLYGDGWTPLHAAAVSGRSGIVKQLLTAAGPGAGSLVTACNRYGQTCVHVAARKGTPALIQALLDAGGPGSAGVPDSDGRTAADVARQMGNACALGMLGYSNGARASQQKDRGAARAVERPRPGGEKSSGGARWVGRRLQQRRAQTTKAA